MEQENKMKDNQYIDEFGYEKCGIYGECNIGEFFECSFCGDNGDDDEE